MKRQFDIGSGNEQISDNDTTTQIQINFSKWWAIVIILIILIVAFWEKL